ncbi:MAG TPA: hypothetical protein VHL57_00365 [Flavobacteriales bacterium]|jgi:hypothetical protein|nr:hypothetical protein [Flavobacteriales bacterium]
MRWTVLLPLLIVLSRLPSYGQSGIRDTSITIIPITLSYAYQLPTGDMADRFGWNNNIGLSTLVKFKNNYALGLEGSFFFGNQVNERTMLNGLTTSNGRIVNQEGEPAQVFLYERGYTILGVAAKIIPVVGPNPNSGILLKFGAGYMRHKIRIETQNDEVPAIEGEYLKGYDRLTAGPMLMLFAGYQHFGNSRLVNFMVGWELNLAFTQSLRPFNFDTGKADETNRRDGLNGLRVGWTLPIYRHVDDRIHYR